MVQEPKCFSCPLINQTVQWTPWSGSPTVGKSYLAVGCHWHAGTEPPPSERGRALVSSRQDAGAFHSEECPPLAGFILPVVLIFYYSVSTNIKKLIGPRPLDTLFSIIVFFYVSNPPVTLDHWGLLLWVIHNLIKIFRWCTVFLCLYLKKVLPHVFRKQSWHIWGYSVSTNLQLYTSFLMFTSASYRSEAAPPLHLQNHCFNSGFHHLSSQWI